MTDLWPYVLAAVQIIWINVILSGDNAVVIALACRGLPPSQRELGMTLGAGVAVVLRVVFTLVIVELLAAKYLKLVGGALLLWIAVKLVGDEHDDGAHTGKIRSSNRLMRAVWTVTVADAVMSLDNVLAIAGVARNNTAMLIFGLAVSIPLIIAGAGLVMTVLDRFPALVWAGAGLLGWIAADMMVTDLAVLQWLKANFPAWLKAVPREESAIGMAPVAAIAYGACAAGVALVLGAGYWLKTQRQWLP